MIVQAHVVDLEARAILTDTSWELYAGARWPGNTDGVTSRSHLAVPYRFKSGEHGPNQQEMITISFNQMSQYMMGCVQFVDDTTAQAHESFIEIINGEGCYSNLGWEYPHGYINVLSLNAGGCLNSPTIQHELLHAMGMEHEQSRPDRDDYINIHYEYIEEYLLSQFEKLPSQFWMETGSPYDIDSVMHYPWWAGLTGDGWVIDASVMSDKQTGAAVQKPERERMSSEDVFQFAAMYESFCPASILPVRTCDDGQKYLSQFAW